MKERERVKGNKKIKKSVYIFHLIKMATPLNPFCMPYHHQQHIKKNKNNKIESRSSVVVSLHFFLRKIYENF